MIINYIKTAIRNILRNKIFSVINILGLSIGMAVCLLIMLWVKDELSFDKFHDHSDRLYRVLMDRQATSYTQKYTPAIAGPNLPDLQSKYPEIVLATRVYSFENLLARTIQYKEKIFNEKLFGLVDPDFFEMFSFSFISGDPKTVFSNLNSAVITKSFAKKLFGDEDPMGKTIRVDATKTYIVTGILLDFPKNSHLNFNVLIPFEQINTFITQYGNVLTRQDYYYCFGYIMLESGASPIALQEKSKTFFRDTYGSGTDTTNNRVDNYTLNFQPLGKIHLYSNDIRQISKGDINQVRIFSIIAVFILLIACFNYINLSTAWAERRSKEVAMRKISGATRKQLIFQFMGESFILTFISVIISIILIELFRPYFNILTQKSLIIDYKNLIFISSIVTIWVTTGFLAGSYPSFVLSSFSPIKVLKKLYSPQKRLILRRLLVVTQFVIAIVLILSAYIVLSQYKYMQNRDLGFNKDQLIYVNAKGELLEKFDFFRNELLGNSSIINVARSSSILNRGYVYTWDFDWEGMDEGNPPESIFYYVAADENFIETCGIKLASGHNFLKNVNDNRGQILINEETLKVMNVESPIGLSTRFGKIAGVVKNYHFQSLRDKVRPLIIWPASSLYRYIYIKIRPENFENTINFIEEKFTETDPSLHFEYRFMDEDFEAMYSADRKMSLILEYFTYLAIFIACLGLLGLVTYTVEQRTKEIGIRKAMGSSVMGVVSIVNREIIICITIANIIAWPIVWLIMNQWLDQFAFRIKIGVTMFIFSGLIMFIIALLTSAYNSIKAGRMNPVDSLRHE